MSSPEGNGQFKPGGYPLGALFVLMALCAVLTVGVAPQIRGLLKGSIDGSAAAVALILSALAGLLLGAVLGLLSHRSALGLLIGAATGPILGIVGGLLALTPPSQIPSTAVAMLAGSATIVLIAFLMRKKE